MKKPDIPADEEARLEALRALEILDTSLEERFDRLTRLAHRMFGVPIALVSLVDKDRQWFKSHVGLDVDETSRDISFCGHAILGNDVFVVKNALEDARFDDNPLVTGNPHIRFYAGCPLKALNGQKLGTLCIIDSKPRTLEQEDIQVLKDLAKLVESELLAAQLATMDELTNISNRRGFVIHAKRSLHLCRRLKIPATLIFFDLDDFKPINDTYGHDEGDRALITFANLLKHQCRGSDIIGRLGGDEFVLLLLNSPKQEADNFVARFNDSLKKYNQEANCGYDLAFSCGIVTLEPNSRMDIEQLLAEGDMQMYQHKQSKR